MGDDYWLILKDRVREILENGSVKGGGFAPRITRLDEYINDVEIEEDGLDEASLGTLAAILGFFQAAYTFGLTRIPGSWAIQGCNSLVERGVRPSDWIRYPASGFWYPQFLAGFIMILILGFLHARYIWFPLEPIGFITGVGVGFGWWGFWTYGLVAWILKTITLRVGGSKLYEEWGAPIASGFIAGHMLALIPGTIISKVRFFIPF